MIADCPTRLGTVHPPRVRLSNPLKGLHMFKRSQRGRAFAVIAAAGALSVTLAACGGSDDSSSDDAASDGGDVEIRALNI